MIWVIFSNPACALSYSKIKSSYLGGTGLFEGLYQFVQFLQYCSRTQLAHSGDHKVGQHLYVIVITETILNKYSSCFSFLYIILLISLIFFSFSENYSFYKGVIVLHSNLCLKCFFSYVFSSSNCH